MKCVIICRPSPSNQSFYRQIAGYQRGAGDHSKSRPMMRGVMGLQNSRSVLIGVHAMHGRMHYIPTLLQCIFWPYQH
jgi:hypothetical protein